MSIDKYILVDGKPVKEPDLFKWAKWLGENNRKINLHVIGGVRVSTVFLGLDHNYTMSGDPVLFETMVFGGPLGGEQYRYCTIEEARMGHAEMIGRVRLSMGI